MKMKHGHLLCMSYRDGGHASVMSGTLTRQFLYFTTQLYVAAWTVFYNIIHLPLTNVTWQQTNLKATMMNQSIISRARNYWILARVNHPLPNRAHLLLLSLFLHQLLFLRLIWWLSWNISLWNRASVFVPWRKPFGDSSAIKRTQLSFISTVI